MPDTTKIEWTHWPNTVGRVWNPTRGCSRISPGCGGAKGVGGCYAERQAYRFSQPTAHTPHPPYEGLVQLGKQGPRWTGKVDLVSDKLSDPIRWRGRSTVFVNSMSDLFHEGLTDDEIDEVFGVMAVCHEHTFIVLTKRADRMREHLSRDRRKRWARAGASRIEDADISFDAIAMGPRALANVVLGVSVENQEWADKRIPHLLDTPAACRMASYEPALGEIDFFAFLRGDLRDRSLAALDAAATPGLDWVVVGGESGPGSRPFDVEWARSTVRACRAAAVPVFVKQLGAMPVCDVQPTPLHRTHDGRRQIGLTGTSLQLRHKKGGDMAEWPEDLQVRELPAIARRHEAASASMMMAQGAIGDGAGSFSMVHVQASGSAEVVGAAIDMAMGFAASMRGDS